MRVKFVIPVLASILILGTLGLSQEASAIDYVVSNEAECLAFPAETTWGFQNLETCFLTSDFTFNAGDTLTVENIEFQASSTITNFGTIELIGGDSFGKGRIDLRGGGHLINECGGTVNANGGDGSQSGELALAGTSIITNFDTINLLGGNGPSSGSILFGAPGGIVNNHGTINENPGAGPSSGLIGLSFSGLNDNLVPKCGPEITVDTDGDQSVGPGESLVIKNGATVNGNVSVDGGILFIMEGCTVNGNIEATNSYVSIESCTVTGDVRTDGDTLIIKNDSTVNGNVEVSNGASVTIDNADINGNVEVSNGVSVTIDDADINGNVIVNDSDPVSITESEINGNIYVTDSQNVIVTGNAVNGNLEITGATGSCTGSDSDNTVTGNVVPCPVKTYIVFYHDENNNGIPNANCLVRAFGPTTPFLTEMGTTDENGFFTATLPLGVLQALTTICNGTDPPAAQSCFANLPLIEETTLLNLLEGTNLDCGFGGGGA